MKLIRWILTVFISLLALCVIAVVLLVNFVNPNDYRDQINKAISDKIQRPFVIQGNISWLFFPELGFKVQNINIGDEANKRELSAKLDQLAINLKIWPLLHKQVAIDALRLQGLQVILPYQAPAVTKPSNAAANNTDVTKNPLAALAGLPTLNLEEFSVDNSAVTQLDKDNKSAWEIRNLSFSAVNLNPTYQFPFQTSFDFVCPASQLTAKVNFKSYFEAALTNNTISLLEPELRVAAKKQSGADLQMNVSLDKIVANFADHALNVEGLQGKLNNLNFSGDAKVKSFDNNPETAGQLKADTSNLKALLTQLGIALPATQSDQVFKKFALDASYKLANNQLTLSPLKMDLDGIQMQGNVTSPDVKNLALNIQLTTSAITAGNYLPKAPTAKQIDLSNLQLNLKLLPPAGDNKNWLASTMNGGINSQAINFDGDKFTNVELLFDAKNQLINFSKIHANAWQGSLDSTAQVNLQKTQPQFVIDPVVKNIQIQGLLHDVAPKANVSGDANLTGTITTAGSDAATLTRNLNGSIKTSVTNGVLHGINLDYWAGVATALYNKEPLPSRPQNNNTAFGTLSASLTINQGMVSNRDFMAQTNFAQATGQGTINLNNQVINYHLQVVKKNQATGGLHNDIVPLIISGTLDNPSVQPDMEMIAKQIISKQIDKQKDKLTQKIDEQIGQKIGNTQVGQQITNVLGNLLGGK